jgi:hypothetical protein
MWEAISPNYQTKGEVATKVLLKLETDLNNSLIVRLDLCLGRMSIMSGCSVIYSTKLDAFLKTCIAICVKFNSR